MTLYPVQDPDFCRNCDSEVCVSGFLDLQRKQREIEVELAELRPSLAPTESNRLVPGGSFILDAASEVEAIWGTGKEVIQAAGEG